MKSTPVFSARHIMFGAFAAGVTLILIWRSSRTPGKELSTGSQLLDKLLIPAGSTPAYDPKTLPNSGSGLPKDWATGPASLLVDELYEVINGWVPVISSNTKRKIQVMSKFLALTDDQLTVVYNVYNYRYGKKERETMTEAINAEYMWPSNDVQKQLVGKLRSLGLR